jgi:hypothetical protein
MVYQNVDYSSLPPLQPKNPLPQEAPVYENCDLKDVGIYQNVRKSTKGGKMIPASREDDEVYAKVRFLRKSVQEVNELLGRDGPVDCEGNGGGSRRVVAFGDDPLDSLIVPRPETTFRKGSNASANTKHQVGKLSVGH